MDKAEYKTKLENISALAENGRYKEAAAAADEVDWKRVRSVRTLCMIAEIYSANKRYKDALRLLTQAYRRSPSARTVLYGMAEMEIRLGDFQAAEKYINEFEQNAPGDTSDYVLRYKLLHAKQAPLDDQIKVLRDYKELEYTERWAYELAKLYKQNGQKEKCVEECDDLILWFGEGRFVKKALELKKTIKDLTPVQQKILTRMIEEEASTAKAQAADDEKKTAENKNIKILAEETMRKLDAAAGAAVANRGNGAASNEIAAAGNGTDSAPDESAAGEETSGGTDENAAGVAAENYAAGVPDAGLSGISAGEMDDVTFETGAQALETRAKVERHDIQAAAAEGTSDAEETAAETGEAFAQPESAAEVADAEETAAETPAEAGEASAQLGSAAETAGAGEAAEAEIPEAGEAAENAEEIPLRAQSGEEVSEPAEAEALLSGLSADRSEESRGADFDEQATALKAAIAREDTRGMEKEIIKTGYEEVGLAPAQKAREKDEEDEASALKSLLPDAGRDEDGVPALESESDAGGRTVNKAERKPGLFARIADSLRLEDTDDEEDQMASALSAAAAQNVPAKKSSGDELAESLERAEMGQKEAQFSDTVGRLERAGNAAAYQRGDALERRTRYSAFTGEVTRAGGKEISGSDVPAGENAEEKPDTPEETANTDTGDAAEPDARNAVSDEKKREDSGRSGDTPSDSTPEEPPVKTAEAETAEQSAFGETTSRPMTDDELQQLFNETTNQLKSDIAEGGYELTDTIKEEEGASGQQNTAPGKEPGGKVHELLGRETDESLGLTREINYKSIEKALASGRQSAESAPGGAIPDPDSAARATAFEANGKPLPADDVDASVGTVSDYGEGEMTDEELMEALNIDDEAKKELLADESEETGAEQASENLMDMSTVAPAAQEENRSIIENIMEKPNVYTRLPLEGRRLTDAEKKAFSYFAKVPGVDYQVTTAIADIHNNCGDKTSRSGNVIIMGRQGSGKTRLAEGLVMAVCMNLGMKACKLARFVADEMNTKDPAKVVAKLSGGFLLIEAAGSLDDRTISGLNQAMEFRTDDLIVILEDEKADMRKMLEAHPDFAKKFTSSITVPVFMNDELVTFAKTYAKEQGYKLDELATLALYTIIGENQRDDEPVTVGRVKRVVDKAIEKNSRKFFGKTQDSTDGRILLREKDFNF